MKFYIVTDDNEEGAIFTTKKGALDYIKEMNKNPADFNDWIDDEYEHEGDIWTENHIETVEINVRNKKTTMAGLSNITFIGGGRFRTPEFE